MKKILFVCLGNICRSPLAEAIFQNIVDQAELSSEFLVDSSGTSAWHVGEEPDPRMQLSAAKHSVPMNHKAQQFQKRHFADFDLIFAMDQDNYHDITSLTQNSDERKKVRLLREFDSEAINAQAAVPDPYYGGAHGFEDVYQICTRSCEKIFELIQAKKL